MNKKKSLDYIRPPPELLGLHVPGSNKVTQKFQPIR